MHSKTSIAATFIVTTNADSGPGSLRDALTQASGNGIASPDLITFNIADQSQSGRTITLLTQLPAVSSNLVIDGTTQAGTVFGNSDARVKLYLSFYPPNGDFAGLLVENADNAAIYGLELASIRSGAFIFGIRLRNSSHVRIGDKGKGNLICGWAYDVSNVYSAYSSDNSNNISIKGNIMGLQEDGSNTGDLMNIDFNGIHDLEVGGTDAAEGNLLQATYYSVDAIHQDPLTPGSFFAKVINNRIDVDPSGNVANSGAISQAVQLTGTNSVLSDTETVKTLVSNNIISGQNSHIQLSLQNIGHLIKVTGNRIGTNAAGTSQIGSADVGIFISNCNKALVGGDQPGDVNFIAGNEWGVDVQSPKVLITKNSMFCNIKGINIPFWSFANPKPVVEITGYTSAEIKGTSNPFSRIEVFDNQTCNSSCQGKTYINTVYADGAGNWSYTGPQTNSMTVTGTTPDSATSEFPEPLISTSNMKVAPAACGNNNGSVTGIQILGGTNFKWLDQHGNIVGANVDISGLSPGYYTFFVSNGPNGCPVSVQVQIDDVQPPPSVTTSLYNTTCGERNGQIVVSGNIPSGLTSRWINSAGDTVVFRPSGNLFNAGSYSLVLYPTVDNSCVKLYGPYVLTNQGGPSIDISTVQVTPASCRLPNGSIKSLQINNLTGTPFFRWVDENDLTVGNSADLLNVPAGRYRLKMKDMGPCDTAVSDVFTVGSTGLVQMDSTTRITVPSKCSAPSGGVENISVRDVSSYQWVDLATRAVVGNTANLTMVSMGSFRLIATNTYGCKDSTGVYEVPFTPIFSLSATYNSHPESCNRQDGVLSINTLNSNLSDYSYRWTFTSTGQLVGVGTSIEDLIAGSYSLYATDNNGCEQLVGTPYLDPAPAPEITGVAISPDVCLLGNGSIGLTVKGASPFTYSWYDAGMQQLSTGALLSNESAGRYSVAITDNNRCMTTASYSIADSSVSLDGPTYPSLTILKDETAQLVPDQRGTGIYSLYSYPPPGDPAAQDAAGMFTVGPLAADTTVYVRLKEGSCVSPVTAVRIKVIRTVVIVMPNAFTPNQDGQNDIFKVKYPDVIKTIKMKIFDRWGRMVFASEDALRGWDGNLAGRPEPAGTYVYQIHYQDLFGKNADLSGTVLLVR
ncbi:MAG TPA: gliding motility-associated C-terminal domain-containing protein [Puia sp.]